MDAIQYSDATRKFHKAGTLRLAYYEFLCGYAQRVETPDCTVSAGISLTLWMEHRTFHVRAHNFTTDERIFWDSFDTMTQANRRFFKAKKELGL